MTVGELCTRQVVTARPDDAIIDVARLMRDKHVGDVVVLGNGPELTRPVGILTDRDIVVGVVAQTPDKLETLRVGDVMTHELVTAQETDTVDTALAAMRSRGVRRLPVVNAHGLLRGILTFDDVIEVMSEELNDLVKVVAREQNRERDVRM